MDQILMEYLDIELTGWGLTFDSAPLYFNLSWLGLGLILAGLVAFKISKRMKRAK